jgi:hypothetical protein
VVPESAPASAGTLPRSACVPRCRRYRCLAWARHRVKTEPCQLRRRFAGQGALLIPVRHRARQRLPKRATCCPARCAICRPTVVIRGSGELGFDASRPFTDAGLMRDRPTLLSYGALGAYSFWLYAFGPAVALLRSELGLSYTMVGVYSAAWSLGAVIAGTGYAPLTGRVVAGSRGRGCSGRGIREFGSRGTAGRRRYSPGSNADAGKARTRPACAAAGCSSR